MMTLSASQLKDFDRCPRAWWLKYVARVPDDVAAGGKFLIAGTAFDELVQLQQSRLSLDPAAVRKSAVRHHPSVTAETLDAVVDGAFRQLRVVEAALPRPKSHAVQFSYRIPVPGRPEFVVTGKPDLRQPGVIRDTKTTSDRGPGRGAGPDRPAYALTDATTPGGNLRPLNLDVQALLYAWCEFQLDLALAEVEAEWLYVSKCRSPRTWSARAGFARAEVDAWFQAWVLPRAEAMAVLKAGAAAGEDVPAAPETGCARCFTKLSCSPLEGAQRPEGSEKTMAFDLKALKRRPGGGAPPVAIEPGGDLEAQLEASLVAINRPRSLEDRLTAIEARLSALEGAPR